MVVCLDFAAAYGIIQDYAGHYNRPEIFAHHFKDVPDAAR